MPPAVRAIRGATTVDADTEEQVTSRVQALLGAILERNRLAKDDLISIIFTATDDVGSMFPATAARRAMDLGDVPLLGARELSVDGAQPRCIRVLVHVSTELERKEISHVYLEEARGLRDDLAD